MGAAGLVAAATSLTCAQRTGTDSTLTQCAVLPVVNVASILILVCFHCPQVLVKKSLPDMQPMLTLRFQIKIFFSSPPNLLTYLIIR